MVYTLTLEHDCELVFGIVERDLLVKQDQLVACLQITQRWINVIK